MGFSEKIKAYFAEKGMTNRDVSKVMGDYSESLVSRHLNSDKISKTFIENLGKYFPDLDMNYLLKDDEELSIVSEQKEEYKTRNAILIEEITERLDELKKNLSQI
jgi:hypothetical protein